MRECDECNECKQLQEKQASTQKVLDQAVTMLAEWAVSVDQSSDFDHWKDKYLVVRDVSKKDDLAIMLKEKFESEWPVQCCECREYKAGMMQDDLPDAVCQSCVDISPERHGYTSKGFDTRLLEAQNNGG